VLASPTQAETAHGVSLLTYISQKDRAIRSKPNDHILRYLYEVLFSILKCMFSAYLHLQMLTSTSS
jgi:hypothetical protein